MTLSIVPFGENSTRIWGMSARERLSRIARAQGHGFADAAPTDGQIVAADLTYAFDPQWMRFVSARRGTVVTIGGRPALAHVAAAQLGTIAAGEIPAGVAVVAFEDSNGIENEELRKREVPFLLPLTPATVPAVERASYWGAYKGVTDLLTKYLWPELAFHLTRLAAALRMTPNMVTAIGIALCIAATWFFWEGQYWTGLALGFIFMVLDTVDGKLARCTITSSKIGDVLDHGVDLVHPPFWWWAWLHGLSAYGTPLRSETEYLAFATIVVGYIVQRIIEGIFIKAFGMHIHVWTRTDSRFRLVTARRNPNVVILAACLAFGHPDLGILAVAWWTALSCLFHAVRVIQAYAERARGRAIVSWLS